MPTLTVIDGGIIIPIDDSSLKKAMEGSVSDHKQGYSGIGGPIFPPKKKKRKPKKKKRIHRKEDPMDHFLDITELEE